MSRETGAGLFSTAPDYLAFTGMLLAGGVLDGVRVLKQETVKLMARNASADPNVLMGAQQQSRIGARSRDIPWSGQEMEVDLPTISPDGQLSVFSIGGFPRKSVAGSSARCVRYVVWKGAALRVQAV